MTHFSVCSSSQARKCDQLAIHSHHIPALLLMEQAAFQSCLLIEEQIKADQNIVILCGPGNNGADGMAIARLLYQKDYAVKVIHPLYDLMSEDEKIQYNIIDALHITKTKDEQQAIEWISSCDCLIDCLFGNGLNRNIEEPYLSMIQTIHESKPYTISIDMPSGIHATTGQIMKNYIPCDLLISLDCFKEGQWIHPGNQAYQEITCVPIGIDASFHQKDTIYLDSSYIQKILPSRLIHAHKGTYHKACMIGGSQNMHGAIKMAAEACYRSGIGTLTLMIPDCIQTTIQNTCPFAMMLSYPSQNGFFHPQAIDLANTTLNNFDIISIGNGMGLNPVTEQFVSCVLQIEKIVVIDADGLNALQGQMDLLHRKAPTILTPHIKEMSVLMNCSIQDILKDPFGITRQFCLTYPNCILILKSSHTWIGQNDQLYLYSHPHSALAKGGSGDILCGIITGLLGQTSPLEASLCAVAIHNQCAWQIKKDPASLLPADLIHAISSSFEYFR